MPFYSKRLWRPLTWVVGADCTLTNCTFCGVGVSAATPTFGAIYVDDADVEGSISCSVSGCAFEDNAWNKSGSSIYLATGDTFSCVDCVFKSCNHTSIYFAVSTGQATFEANCFDAAGSHIDAASSTSATVTGKLCFAGQNPTSNIQFSGDGAVASDCACGAQEVENTASGAVADNADATPTEARSASTRATRSESPPPSESATAVTSGSPAKTPVATSTEAIAWKTCVDTTKVTSGSYQDCTFLDRQRLCHKAT
jgi:hypothetical protein